MSDRQKKISLVTNRLFIFAAIAAPISAGLFAATYLGSMRFMMSWHIFLCGIVGGFTSIQQRLKSISEEELSMISESWATILVIPMYGGVFAFVLYSLFLSGIINGVTFPQFYIPEFHKPPTTEDFINFFLKTRPATGSDFAKLSFWSFLAGFSERFVPTMIKNVSNSNK
jgi:hypothetical protein